MTRPRRVRGILQNGDAVAPTGPPVAQAILLDRCYAARYRLALEDVAGDARCRWFVGEEIAAGNEGLKVGTRISPGSLTLLTALGIQSMQVFRRAESGAAFDRE